jgi:TolB protein
MWLDVNKNNQIIYASIKESGNSQLYVLNPDQSKAAQIPTPFGAAQFPGWSPDGNRVVFAAPDDNGVWQIYTMAKDGTDVRKVTTGVHPSWSPDGKRIAFARETSPENWDIYAVNTDGSNPVQLTSGGANELEPDWSPDGRNIAYTSVTGSVAAFFSRDTSGTRVCPKSAIYMKNIADAGATPVQLVAADSQNVHPRWSPDGKKIVFVSDRSGSLDIWLMTLPSAQ